MTVRNLDETVKQKLRLQAAKHGRSVEAEVRDILAKSVAAESELPASAGFEVAESGKGKFDHLVGIWKGRMTTDELMQATRGED